MAILDLALSYMSQSSEKIAPRIEQLVRQELGAPTPIPYQILPGESTGTTAGSLLSEWAHAQVHLRQNASSLFYIHFVFAWPRQFELQVSILRQGLGALAGKFAFAVPLAKPVRSPISLLELHLRSRGFAGDPETVTRLNGNRDLLAKAYHLCVTKSRIGKTDITIPHYLQVQPARTGSMLIVHRLAQPGILTGANVGVKDLLDFVPVLDYYL